MIVGVWAQNATSSPSSRFGYGELNDNLPGAYRAMGGLVCVLIRQSILLNQHPIQPVIR